MPLPSGYTVGKDVSLVIQTAAGKLTLPGLTDFSSDPITLDIKSKPMTTGEPIHDYIPDGWRMSFKVDRMDSSVDDFWANFEAAYYAGAPLPPGTVYETITENDGTVSQWRYTRSVVKLDKAGDKSADKKVEQTLSGMASRRVRVV
jgi:hypothetical protein